MKVSGNPSQYDDLSLFVQEQELMKMLVSESTLPCLTLDISDNDIASAVENIATWMEKTSQLYMD